MKKIYIVTIFLSFFFCVNTFIGYGEDIPVTKTQEIKTYDVNKDNKPDVTYFKDGENISMAEADTNNDGKPDVIIYLKDGKFDSADVDTDYNGTFEKKFTDVSEFNKWLNDKHSDFNEHLNRANWQFALLNF